jgi:hypothetical protein
VKPEFKPQYQKRKKERNQGAATGQRICRERVVSRIGVGEQMARTGWKTVQRERERGIKIQLIHWFIH